MQKIYVEVKKIHDLALIVTYLGCSFIMLFCVIHVSETIEAFSNTNDFTMYCKI